jgi:hypothetical protein
MNARFWGFRRGVIEDYGFWDVTLRRLVSSFRRFEGRFAFILKGRVAHATQTQHHISDDRCVHLVCNWQQFDGLIISFLQLGSLLSL